MKIFASLLAASLVTVCGAQTLIGPLPYLSSADSPFDTGAATYVLETFEDGLFNTPGVTASGSNQVVGPGGLADSVDSDDGAIDGSGTLGRSYFHGSGGTGITFIFDAAVLGGLPTEVGIVWTDGAGTTSFQAFGEGGVSLGTIGPVPIADASHTGGTSEDRFFGIIHAAGIASIKVTNTSGGIEVDHLQFTGSASGCPSDADLNNDGQVDGADLGALLAAWGACPAGCCEEDLTNDGQVDGADLGMLLSEWG